MPWKKKLTVVQIDADQEKIKKILQFSFLNISLTPDSTWDAASILISRKFPKIFKF